MFKDPVGRGFPKEQITNEKGNTVPANTITNIWTGGDSRHITKSTKGSSVSMTIASPCVVTYPASGEALSNNEIVFYTTGALPTGITAGTTYYILSPTGSTSNISATAGGAAINTSGTQSGTQTAVYNVPINSFGVAPNEGAEMHCVVDIVTVLTHSTNLSLPGSANITTAAGDHFDVYADTTTQFDIRNYTQASGASLGLKAATMIVASGATVDFTGIPAGVKKIHVCIDGLNDDNVGNTTILQLGDSGGLESTGYKNIGNTVTDGFSVSAAIVSTEDLHGMFTLVLMNSATNLWIMNGNSGSNIATAGVDRGGSKALTGTLDRLSLLRIGTGNYGGGNVNIVYE